MSTMLNALYIWLPDIQNGFQSAIVRRGWIIYRHQEQFYILIQ